MKQFEVGKTYGAYDSGTPSIRIIKRTPKMCLVEDTLSHNQWRMKRVALNDHEEMIDSTVPESWRRCYTYSARFEKEE